MKNEADSLGIGTFWRLKNYTPQLVVEIVDRLGKFVWVRLDSRLDEKIRKMKKKYLTALYERVEPERK